MTWSNAESTKLHIVFDASATERNDHASLNEYCFTWALFGLTCSPSIPAGVINQYLDIWAERYPEIVKQLREGIYVDNLMTGGMTIAETKQKKATATEVFEDTICAIHKSHSNTPQLQLSVGSKPKWKKSDTQRLSLEEVNNQKESYLDFLGTEECVVV